MMIFFKFYLTVGVDVVSAADVWLPSPTHCWWRLVYVLAMPLPCRLSPWLHKGNSQNQKHIWKYHTSTQRPVFSTTTHHIGEGHQQQGASRSSYPTFSSPWSFVWAWTSAGASGARWPTMGEGQRWATPRLDRQPNLSHHQDFRGQRSCPQCTSGWRLMTLFKRRHLKRVNYRPETRGNISEILCCL